MQRMIVILMSVLFQTVMVFVTRVSAQNLGQQSDGELSHGIQSTVNFGEVICDSIASPSEINTYTFSANAGDRIIARMSISSGTLWAGLRVVGVSGNTLRQASSFPTAEIDTLTLQISGTYSILCYDGFNGTRTGNYCLFLQQLNNPSNAKTIEFGQTLSDTLNRAPETRAFTFSASSGDKIIIRMSIVGGTMWSGIRVYNPSGRRVRIGNSTPTTELDTLSLPVAGRYTLLAYDGFDGTRTGNFNLFIQRVVNPSNAITIEYGQVNNGSIIKSAEMDAFTFSGVAGKRVLIRMSIASGTMWAGLRVYSPTGKKLRSTSSFPTAQIDTLTLPINGSYTLLAYDSFSGTRNGNYNLSLLCLTPPCTPADVAAFALNSTSLTFTNVSIGDSLDQTLELRSTGTAPLIVSSISLEGNNADQFKLIGTTSFTLDPNQTRNLVVRFKPTSTGAKQARLAIAHNAAGSPTTVNLSGNPGTPSFQLSATSLDFGSVQTGSSRIDTLIVTNPGSATLNVTSAAISGANAAEFALSTPTNFSVQPNASAKLVVRFLPTSIGSKNALLTLTHNAAGSPSTAALSGTGVTRAISALRDSLHFAAVNIGEFFDSNVTISNPGAFAVTVTSIEIAGGDTFAFALIGANGFTLLPQQQREIVIRLRPLRLGDFSAELRIFYNAPESPLVVRLSGTGVDLIAPTISNVNAVPTVDLGKPVLVTARVFDNYKLDHVNLQYRQGGQSAFTELKMDSTEAGYSATIPGAAATARGVEFNIEAIDLARNSSATAWQSIRVRLPDKHLTFAQRGSSRPPAQSDYRLISFPLDSDDPAIAASLLDDLDPADTLKWRLWDIDPQRSTSLFPYREYPNVGNLAPGTAKFLITRENKTLTSSTGLTVETTKPLEIVLQPGWNMIGSPFNFDIPMQNVQPENLRQHVNAFDGAWQSQPSHLQPWSGYLIKATEQVTLRIQPAETPQFAMTKSEIAPDWLIRLEAESENARDVDNFVGVIADAEEAWDRYERFEPPPIGAFVMLAFPRQHWQRYPDVYTTDFRPAAREGYVWNFTLTTHLPGKAATLRFNDLDAVPVELEIRLLDVALNLIQDVRRNHEYVCRTNASALKSFRLLVGPKEFIAEHSAGLAELPSGFELSQNFPNPFNPSTAIKIGLPEKARVTLKIYDVLGHELATLWNEVEKEAGYHVAIWEGKDHQGNLVPSGLYLYRLQMGPRIWMKKMALVR